MKKRLKRRSGILAVATCAIAALVTLGGTTFAHAANEQIGVGEVGGTEWAGAMSHIDDGDTFRVHDFKADGHGVRGSLLDANGNVIKSSYNGNGLYGGYTSFQYNILSGKKYYMNVCLVDGASDTTPLKCASQVLYE